MRTGTLQALPARSRLPLGATLPNKNTAALGRVFVWRRHPEFRGSPGAPNVAARFPHKRCGNRADPPMTGNMNETTRNFACGEDSLALRLVSELRDRRAANADRDLASLACKVLSAFGSNTSKQKHGHFGPCFRLEAPPGIGPGIKVLQTSALPLGYGALSAGISLPYSIPSVKHKLLHPEKKLENGYDHPRTEAAGEAGWER